MLVRAVRQLCATEYIEGVCMRCALATRGSFDRSKVGSDKSDLCCIDMFVLDLKMLYLQRINSIAY